jgi:hypothetical protein
MPMMSEGVMHEGTVAEVDEYQEREAKVADLLADSPQWVSDSAMTLTQLIEEVSRGDYYISRRPSRHAIEVIEHTNVIEDSRANLAEGDAVLGVANLWKHPLDGEPRVTIEIRVGVDPLAAIHEVAHAIEIDAGHGPEWIGHFGALVEERYGLEAVV